MKKIITMFCDSGKEFKSIRTLATTALLIAIHTILSLFFSVQVSDSLRISISFICKVVIGAFYGPVVGFVSGGLCDIVQYVIKPSGPFHPGFTLDAAIAGLIYGLFFYKKFPAEAGVKKIDFRFLGRSILGVFTEIVVVNLLLATFWLSRLIGTPFWVLLIGPRSIKNFIQFPLNVLLTYYTLSFVKVIYNRMR